MKKFNRSLKEVPVPKPGPTNPNDSDDPTSPPLP